MKKGRNNEYTLISAMEEVLRLSKNSFLEDGFWTESLDSVTYITEKLAITKEEAVFLAIIVDRFGNHTSLNDIAKHLGISALKALQFNYVVDELLKKQFILESFWEPVREYYMSKEVVDAFVANAKFTPKSIENLTNDAFFESLEQIFTRSMEDNLPFDYLTNLLESLLRGNKHLLFVERLEKEGLTMENKVVFLYGCHLLVNDNNEKIVFDFFDFQNSKSRLAPIIRSLQTEESPLIRRKLLAKIDSNSPIFKGVVITEKARVYFLRELLGKKEDKGVVDRVSIWSEVFPELSDSAIFELSAYYDVKNKEVERVKISPFADRTSNDDFREKMGELKRENKKISTSES